MAYNTAGELAVGEGAKSLVAMAVRKSSSTTTGDETFSYIFCSNSAEMYRNGLIGNSSIANRDIISAVIQNISK